MVTTSDEDTIRLWHIRLGHPGIRSLQGLVSQGLLKGVKSLKMDFCEHCILGKQTHVKFAGSLHQTDDILDYIHTDVWGPTQNPSLGEKRYFVTFVDDLSKRFLVYFMDHKHEALEVFKD